MKTHLKSVDGILHVLRCECGGPEEERVRGKCAYDPRPILAAGTGIKCPDCGFFPWYIPPPEPPAPKQIITPSPGEAWRNTDGRGNSSECFIAISGKTLYRVWAAVDTNDGPLTCVIHDDMIDGQNGWQRVYSPEVKK